MRWLVGCCVCFLKCLFTLVQEEDVSCGPTLTVSSAATPEQKPKHPPTSPLLSSLLQSKFKTADSLQQLKNVTFTYLLLPVVLNSLFSQYRKKKEIFNEDYLSTF